MTLDKLIEELQELKAKGTEGSAKMYFYDEEFGYVVAETIAVDSDGDVIMSQ